MSNALLVQQNFEEQRLAESKRWVNVWRIALQNNTHKRYTDHNQDIDFTEPILALATFKAAGGFGKSAERSEAGLRNRDQEIAGMISAVDITVEDLQAGLYDKAELRCYMVDWLYPWNGPLDWNSYFIRKISYSRSMWRADVVTATHLMVLPIGEIHGRDCETDLFDNRCTLIKADHLRANANISAVTDRGRFRLTSIPATFNPSAVERSPIGDDHFKHGEIQVASGLNLGMTLEIKKYTHSTREIELQLPAPFNFVVDDKVDLWVGCTRVYDTSTGLGNGCVQFANEINYQGNLYIPDSDEMQRVPRRHGR